MDSHDHRALGRSWSSSRSHTALPRHLSSRQDSGELGQWPGGGRLAEGEADGAARVGPAAFVALPPRGAVDFPQLGNKVVPGAGPSWALPDHLPSSGV